MRRHATFAQSLGTVLVLAGCTTRPSGGAARPRSALRELAPAGRVVTARDLEAVERDEAIAGLRASFLRYQGTEPTVYVDGARAGSVGALRQLPVRWVARVQILSAMDAAQRYGTSRGGAAIEVTKVAAR